MQNFNKPPLKVYETLDPSSRFVDLAQAILDEFGTTRQAEPGVPGSETSHTWPSNTSGPHYELSVRSKRILNSTSTEYILEHYPASGETPARYRVRNGGPIRFIDEANVEFKLNQDGSREVQRQALLIVSSAMRGKAEELVEQSVNKAFTQVIGSIILSDLAVRDSEGYVPAIDADAANDAGFAHKSRVFDITEEIAEQSLVPESGMDADKVRAAVDAFTGMRPPQRQLNVVALTRYVADKLKPSWKNTIEPDIDRQYDAVIAERFAKKS